MLACAVVALTATARADDRSPAAAGSPPPLPAKGGYSYMFDDDPLRADLRSSEMPLIRVASHAVRQLLIRPRTAFVPELLQTVETL
jgi:hypothetical protein